MPGKKLRYFRDVPHQNWEIVTTLVLSYWLLLFTIWDDLSKISFHFRANPRSFLGSASNLQSFSVKFSLFGVILWILKICTVCSSRGEVLEIIFCIGNKVTTLKVAIQPKNEVTIIKYWVEALLLGVDVKTFKLNTVFAHFTVFAICTKNKI